jgi:hypothetical protein
MVVYVDGKPIFVESSKLKQPSSESTTNSVKLNHKLIQFAKTNKLDSTAPTVSSSSSPVKLNTGLHSSTSLPSTPNNKPVTKIPYLLAAAAAASNNRKLKQSSKLVLSDCARSSCYLINNNNTQSKIKDSTSLLSNTSSDASSSFSTIRQDHEYNQLVSMFRQKNEKLHNPLLNKSF